MKAKKLMLVIALAVLAFTPSMFAATKLVLSPTDATIAASGPNSSLALDAISSTAASNLKWFVVATSPKVGHLDATTGVENRFHADGPGTAIVIVQDDAGNLAFTKIVVVQSSAR